MLRIECAAAETILEVVFGKSSAEVSYQPNVLMHVRHDFSGHAVMRDALVRKVDTRRGAVGVNCTSLSIQAVASVDGALVSVTDEKLPIGIVALRESGRSTDKDNRERAEVAYAWAVVLLDDFPSPGSPAGQPRWGEILTEPCGDKKNRNPHVLPIFLLITRLFEKGHSFIMDSSRQARTKATTMLAGLSSSRRVSGREQCFRRRWPNSRPKAL